MEANQLQVHVQDILEEQFSYEEDLSREYVLEQEYQSEEEDLPEKHVLEEAYVSEEPDSEEEDMSEEPDSEEEDLPEEADSYEDLSEERVSEENSEEEDMLEEPDSEEEYLPEETDSDEDLSEERVSEEDSEEENLSMKHPYKKKNWLEEYFFNENWLTEHGFGINGKELSTSDENMVKEHGFVFKKKTVATKECVVEIVIVGKENCGKTQLIEKVFGDQKSLTVTNHETRNEYRIHFSENLSFHVWIHDVKDIEFVNKTYFRYKTVFIFCFAYDDPGSLTHIQQVWIPLLSQKPMIKMFHFLVGIVRNLETKRKIVAGINILEYKLSMRRKAKVLLCELQNGILAECSTENKKSMVNVFQSAFDAIYPR